MILELAAALALQPGPAVRPVPSIASPAPARAAELIAVLNGDGDLAATFTPIFLADVPATRLRSIAAQLTEQNGAARGVVRATPIDSGRTELVIAYDRAEVAMTMTVEAAAPGRISGLVITGASARATTIDAVLGELATLPGAAGIAIARLDDAGPRPIARLAADRPFAVGSTFKLLILAELVRAIDAGERRWTDVVPLATRSLPSGILQDWPADAPLTLHSLAALMISRSDNSAADTLLALLGRERVAATARPLGWAPRAGNDPLLSTLEAAKLKGLDQGALAARYLSLPPRGRRAMLAGEIAAAPRTQVDGGRLSNRPTRIDSIEWFATPDELIRTLDWFRRAGARRGSAGWTALAILGIMPSLVPSDARRFSFVGYKGGSEAGVISMSTLLLTRGGGWYAISGSWNNPAAPVAEQRFAALMARLATLVAEQDERATATPRAAPSGSVPRRAP